METGQNELEDRLFMLEDRLFEMEDAVKEVEEMVMNPKIEDS